MVGWHDDHSNKKYRSCTKITGNSNLSGLRGVKAKIKPYIGLKIAVNKKLEKRQAVVLESR
jgi:hypothetical protein